MNIDGNPDIVLADDVNGGLVTLLGNGDGTFKAFSETLFAPQLGYTKPNLPLYMVIADFNGDSMPDVGFGGGMGAFNIYPYGAACVAVNTSTINQNPVTFAQPQCAVTQGAIYQVAAADFNHDGQLDLVGANSGPGQGSSIQAYNEGATIFYNAWRERLHPGADAQPVPRRPHP